MEHSHGPAIVPPERYFWGLLHTEKMFRDKEDYEKENFGIESACSVFSRGDQMNENEIRSQNELNSLLTGLEHEITGFETLNIDSLNQVKQEHPTSIAVFPELDDLEFKDCDSKLLESESTTDNFTTPDISKLLKLNGEMIKTESNENNINL